MKIHKEPILQHRIRRLPKEGWSWIDRRFLREYAAALERDAVLLYFFLAAVSDKYGLSYYADANIAAQLRMSEAAVVRAREQLEIKDLIAFRTPLYQVLSLPGRVTRRPESKSDALGDILRGLVSGGSSCWPPVDGRTP